MGTTPKQSRNNLNESQQLQQNQQKYAQFEHQITVDFFLLRSNVLFIKKMFYLARQRISNSIVMF